MDHCDAPHGMTAPTPTPLTRESLERRLYSFMAADDAEYEIERKEVGELLEQIVRCINSHAALVEALKKAHIMLLQTQWRNDDEAMNEVRAVLIQADVKES